MVKKILCILSSSLVGLLLIFAIYLYWTQPQTLPEEYQYPKYSEIEQKDHSPNLYKYVETNPIKAVKTCEGIKIGETPLADIEELKDFEPLADKEGRYGLIRYLQSDECYGNMQASRNLVVFIDGTGQDGKEGSADTNIWRLYINAVKNARTQPIIPFYQEGIGTSWWNRVRGGVAGHGIDKHIKKAYTFLVENYKAGDRIFIFGFSRGAYTARALNGMIEFVGLLNIDKSKLGNYSVKNITEQLFKFYHHKNDGLPLFDERLRYYIQAETKKKYGDTLKFYISHEGQFIVDAIGVFDTVPALGFTRDDYPDDYRVSLYANNGFHALSLDEQRHDFRLLRFANYQIEDQLQEVWFAGDHADVGGGNTNEDEDNKTNEHDKAQNGLEKISREWMIEQLVDAEYKIFNLPKSEDSCRGNKDIDGCERGELHDEFIHSKNQQGILSLVYQTAGLHWRTPQLQDSLHKSILCRLKVDKLPAKNKSKEIDGYRPENLYPCIKQRYNIADEGYMCSNEEAELPKPYGGENCEVLPMPCDVQACPENVVENS